MCWSGAKGEMTYRSFKIVLTLAFWLDFGLLDAFCWTSAASCTASGLHVDSKWTSGGLQVDFKCTPSELPDRLHVQLNSK